jgi:hypothetical protein
MSYNIVKHVNGQIIQYPYTVDQLKKDNPHTSFPAILFDSVLEQYGCSRVTLVPAVSKWYHKVTELPPFPVQGEWTQQWLVEELPSEEIEVLLYHVMLKRLNDLAGARYEREIAGLSFNGLVLKTDDRSKALLQGAAFSATRNPAYTKTWKLGPTERVTLLAAHLIMAHEMLDRFVTNCFDKETEMSLEIQSILASGEDFKVRYQKLMDYDDNQGWSSVNGDA